MTSLVTFLIRTILKYITLSTNYINGRYFVPVGHKVPKNSNCSFSYNVTCIVHYSITSICVCIKQQKSQNDVAKQKIYFLFKKQLVIGLFVCLFIVRFLSWVCTKSYKLMKCEPAEKKLCLMWMWVTR